MNQVGSQLTGILDLQTLLHTVVSLIEHISHQGRSDVKASLVALPSDRPYTQIEADLDDRLRQQLPPPDAENCRGIGAVVVLGNEVQARAALPCADAFERLCEPHHVSERPVFRAAHESANDHRNPEFSRQEHSPDP